MLGSLLVVRPPQLRGAQAAPDFADSAFRQLWERTDQPVASREAERSWYWGPAPGEIKTEPYTGNASGKRLVQYFDKARMEINNPAGDRTSEWYVTTGLLVAEMVSGKQQVGDKQYRALRPAEIAVGGDGLSADPDAPTYTSFRPVASLTGPGANRAPNRVGQQVTATIDRAGRTGDQPNLGDYPGARVAAYSDVLGHNIPAAMWDFLNQRGPVREGNKTLADRTIANWVFVMGYPITEAYWGRVLIGGVYHDVLFQMYERRSLAYIPSMDQGWQVQMGNVGAHYYRWLYGGPLPEPRVPLQAQQGLPGNVNALVEPRRAQVGATLTVTATGFAPGEDIVSWYTAPDSSAFDARIAATARGDGSTGPVQVSTGSLTPGQWALTMHGKSTRNEAVAYFQLTAQSTPTSVPVAGTPTPSTPPRTPAQPTQPLAGSPTPSATVPVVPTEPPGGLVLRVRPGYAPPDGTFTFEASGLLGGEQVQVRFTDPTRVVVYPAGTNEGRYQAAPDGTLSFALVPTTAFPSAPLGLWLFELKGLESGQEGVIGFTLR